MEDIERAFKTISEKRPYLDLLFSYVNGPQPLRYSTERLRNSFSDIKAHFEINWCSAVVDFVLDRIVLKGFDSPDEIVNRRLDELFDMLHLDVEANKVHKAALAAGSGYLILWRSEPTAEIDVYYNDPRLCHVFYDSARPKVKRFAAKWFIDSDGRHEITLYYPDRIEHWRTTQPKENITRYKAFVLDEVDLNPYGVIPVFELRTESEIVKVTSIQDAINKTFADMMVAAEFGAFVQRWVISQADPGDLKNGPNQIWWIPSGDGVGQQSSVGQFNTTELAGYLNAMDKLANSIAIITRTPKHYFMTTGANVSGEALLVMEAPLVKKVANKQTIFNAVWQEIATFLCLLDSGKRINPSDITVVWERVESLQPKTEAETNQIAVSTGIPLITQLRRTGWTESEIDNLMQDKKDEQKTARSLGQQVLDELRIEQEQGNEE